MKEMLIAFAPGVIIGLGLMGYAGYLKLQMSIERRREPARIARARADWIAARHAEWAMEDSQ